MSQRSACASHSQINWNVPVSTYGGVYEILGKSMTHQIGKGRPGRPVILTFCLFLVVSTNACSIAKYNLAGEEFTARSHIGALEYEPPVSLVIPKYYIMHRCGWGGLTPCRDLAGSELYAGVMVAGMGGTLSEHIPTRGLACIVTVRQESDEDYTLRLISAATLMILPAYTSREYVISYDVLLDGKSVREYRFKITENALTGLLMWLFAPVVPFFDNVSIGEMIGARGGPGPMSLVIKKVTIRFLQAAREDGIF